MNSRQKRKIFLVERNPLIADVLQQALKGYAAPVFLSEMDLPKVEGLEDNACSPVILLDQGTLGDVARNSVCISWLRLPSARKIILDQDFSTDQAFSLLLQGAHGFMRYCEVQRDICKAIETVSRKRLWLEAARMEDICLHLQRYWGSRKEGRFDFTLRQKQIMSLVARHLSNKQIAAELRISENTVKFHLGKMFEKTGIRTREALQSLTQTHNGDSRMSHEIFPSKVV